MHDSTHDVRGTYDSTTGFSGMQFVFPACIIKNIVQQAVQYIRIISTGQIAV